MPAPTRSHTLHGRRLAQALLHSPTKRYASTTQSTFLPPPFGLKYKRQVLPPRQMQHGTPAARAQVSVQKCLSRGVLLFASTTCTHTAGGAGASASRAHLVMVAEAVHPLLVHTPPPTWAGSCGSTANSQSTSRSQPAHRARCLISRPAGTQSSHPPPHCQPTSSRARRTAGQLTELDPLIL